jgi:hypothetical protein
MASSRIQIPVGLETTEVRKGAKDAEKALENLEDAVGDAGKGGAKDLDKIEDELKDVQKASKKTGDDVGRNMDDGFKKAGDGASTFKDEADGTAREVAASFDGSAESIAGGFQELAANALAGFGPGGAVLGLAAAAGIGIGTALFQDAQEASEELKESAGEWAQAYIDEGSTVLSSMTLVARGLDIIQNHYDDVVKNSELWGVSREKAAAAMAGSKSDIDDITKSIGTQWDAVQKQIDADGKLTSGTSAQKFELLEAAKALGGVTKAMEMGADQASVYSRLLIDQARNTEGATETVDEFGDTIIALPDGHQVYIDAETGQATDNVDAITAKIYSVPSTTVKVNVDTSAFYGFLETLKSPRSIKIQADMTDALSATGRFGKQPL